MLFTWGASIWEDLLAFLQENFGLKRTTRPLSYVPPCFGSSQAEVGRQSGLEGCLRAPHLTENSKNKHHKVLKMQFQALLGFLFPVTYLIESVMAMSLGSLKKDGQLLDDRKITCFNSSDPVAVNATIVFDFYIDHVTLWERDPKDPLPRCSSSFSSSSSRCNVCQLRMVFIMCSDLTAGAEVTMEGNGAPITIETIDCLKIPSDDGDSAQMGTSAVPQMGTPVIHISFPIVAFIAIVIVVAVVLINRR